mgnify:CR=1 FL=1
MSARPTGVDHVIVGVRDLADAAERWQRIGTAAQPDYRYRDRAGTSGPIRAVTLRGSVLQIQGKGSGSYPLDGAPQGRMVLRLALGSEGELCATTTPREPAARHDTAAIFRGTRNLAAPEACPRTVLP